MLLRIVHNYCIVKFYYLNVTDLIIKYLKNLIFPICEKIQEEREKEKLIYILWKIKYNFVAISIIAG